MERRSRNIMMMIIIIIINTKTAVLLTLHSGTRNVCCGNFNDGIPVKLFFGFFFSSTFLLISSTFENDCLDTCCLGCLICLCFIFLYLHLLNAIEHV